MVVNADPGLASAMVVHRDLVADVDGAASADNRLSCAAPAQLAFDPDLVVNAELQLELFAGRDRLKLGLPDELAVMKHPRLSWQEQQLGAVRHRRAQVSLRSEDRDGKVVERGVEIEPGDRGLVRAAVRR